jgi:hypothetical protein
MSQRREEITEERLIMRYPEIILWVQLVNGGVAILHRDSLGRCLLDAKEEVFIACRPNRLHDLRMPKEIVVLGQLFSDWNGKGGGDGHGV